MNLNMTNNSMLICQSKFNEVKKSFLNLMSVSSPNERLRCTFAIDYSGSTYGSSLYHQFVDKIVTQNYQEGDNIVLWDHNFRIENREHLKYINENRIGNGGTQPQQILHALKTLGNDAREHLYIITDGEIYHYDINKCEEIIRKEGFLFKKVTVYVISNHPNMSVAVPFTRNCPSQIRSISNQYNGEQAITEDFITEEVTHEDFKILTNLETISSLDDFIKNKDSLFKVLTVRMVGTKGDLEIRNKLLQLKQRILRDIASKSKPEDIKIDPLEAISKALRNGNLDEALQYGGQIIEMHKYKKPELDAESFEAQILSMINIASGSLYNSFDKESIKASRATRATSVQEADLNDAQLNVSTKAGTFECPISYEEETDPCLIVTNESNEPLLKNLPPNKVNKILDCPLNLLRHPELIEQLKDRLDHVISLKTIREAHNAGFPIASSPITRRKIVGIIPLGAHPSHVKVANYAISQICTNTKRIGNPELWFALIWLLMKDMERFHEIEPFVREQLCWRLQRRKTTASMSGLASFPQYQLPIGVACWFCVSMPKFPIPYDPAIDLVRLHILHAEYLAILANDVLGFRLPQGTMEYIKLTRAMLALLKFMRTNKLYHINIIKGLYQNTEIILPNTISKRVWETEKQMKRSKIVYLVDGPATEKSRNNILQMLPKVLHDVPSDVLMSIAEKISRSDRGKNIIIQQINFDKKYTTFENEWEATFIPNFEIIPLCRSTMRPFELKYREFVTNILNEEENNIKKYKDIFHGLTFYGKFVVQYQKYPTPEELLLFVNQRIVESGAKKTLMKNPLTVMKNIINAFSPFVDSIAPTIFVKRFLDSQTTPEKRIERKIKLHHSFQLQKNRLKKKNVVQIKKVALKDKRNQRNIPKIIVKII
ncbi:hypothetical protein TRFO_40274 [Tritrichomonas foetus]|uniref:VWFA domain-containing protein n=1 Tax=Tritrichomonas foetus TaxID=1144522 RepID=A0A1J4J7P4_9EUKA|nr:hypothetical protein TRFO_40274 [Tritrichomonas foetus]|eukprot:OHS93453.1 hypothetical protein TRFO_40274 [Tritrichomonas foetus]